jgi:hypothetical protein
MESGSTTTDRTQRRNLLIAAGAGAIAAVGVGGLLVASGASAAPTTPPAAASSAHSDQVGIQAIWAETDAATRHSICTMYLANPGGTWQVLAPVLTAHGADHASTAAHLGQECLGAVTVADLHG